MTAGPTYQRSCLSSHVMKYITIKEITFSKILCGTNALYGRSHFSRARDQEYAARGDDDGIRRVIARCLDFGVNGVESCANERITGILSALSRERREPIRFIGNTRLDHTSPMKSHPAKLNYLLEHRAEICVIHSQFIDRPRTSEEIKGLAPLLEKIHHAGLIAGISTHCISTIELCEKCRYPVDVYLFPLNAAGFVYPGYEGSETVADRIRIVQQTAKPFILMKTLAAGRIPPLEGLRFALENSKPSDLISLGLGSVEEVEESMALALEYLP
jgi:hypothetical protein